MADTARPTEQAEKPVLAFDNDPNKHRYEGKVFRLTFGIWAYRAVFEETVFGNCAGFNNLECAVANVMENLPDGQWGVAMTLTDADGDELLAETEDEDPEEWGMRNLLSAEIIGFAKDTQVGIAAGDEPSNPTNGDSQ